MSRAARVCRRSAPATLAHPRRFHQPGHPCIPIPSRFPLPVSPASPRYDASSKLTERGVVTFSNVTRT